MKITATSGTFTVNELENAVDSLETGCAFLTRTDALEWKWIAFAIHHSLYSFCVTCLCGCNPSRVLSYRKRKDDDGNLCQIGNSPWMRSRRVTIGDGPAYRIKWEPAAEIIPDEDPKPIDPIALLRQQEELPLIGFWTALARVQDSVLWMARLSISNALVLSDEEMLQLVWLNKQVRNDLMHFKPKSYTIFIDGVRTATLTALKAIEFLAVHSHTFIWPLEGNHNDRIHRAIKQFREQMNGE